LRIETTVLHKSRGTGSEKREEKKEKKEKTNGEFASTSATG
jgi:hypothetical protein